MKKKKLSKKMECMVLVLFIFCISYSAAEPCGDVNSDGSIDIIDALLVAQYYVGLYSSNFDAAAADVNGDGSIDILDALLIAQYYVGLIPSLPGCDPTPTPEETEPTPTPECETLEKQAEDADYSSGSVDTNHAGYTGTGFVNTDNAAGEWIEWSVEVGNDCNATCVFRYASGGGARPMNLTINTNDEPDLAFSGSSAWDDWQTETAEVILYTGLNAIRLTAIDSGGAPNMDKMDITICGGPVVTATPSPTPEITPIPTPGPTADPSVPSGPFANQPDGFASLNGGTTGGEGGQTVIVTNQSDLEQYAGASEPYIIKVQGTITISPSGYEVSIASNKTIVGIGADATIKNGGFRIIENRNVILRNLTVRDGSGSDADGLQTDGARNIWVNHIHFLNFSDGVMDIRKDTSYFTASWCFFTDNNRGPTFGWTDITDSKVTMHHCLIRNTVKRNPVFDQGIGHFYNNYSVNISSFGHQARGNARMLVENSYWDNVNDPYGARDSNSILEVRGSIVINSSGTQEGQGGTAFDPLSYYSYTLDPTEDVPDLILNYAGPSDQIQY